jgi:hypothetical protein
MVMAMGESAASAAATGRRRRSRAYFFSPWRQSRNLDSAKISIELTPAGKAPETVPPAAPATDSTPAKPGG